MASRVTETDRQEFRAYLRGLTDQQVRDVYEKERSAKRRVYTGLAVTEAERRGISL